MTNVPLQKGRSSMTCEVCQGSFTVKNSTLRHRHSKGLPPVRYCSWECKNKKATSTTVTVECGACGKLVKKRGYQIKAAKTYFCSSACMGVGKKTGQERPCTECGQMFYVSGHRSKRHHTYFCKNSCRLLYQYRANIAWRTFAFKSKDYKLLSDRLRKSNEGRAWRDAILARDITCVECGAEKHLCVHHQNVSLVSIIADNAFEEEKILQDPRFKDTQNGVTLCQGCHAKRHGLVPSRGNS
jgi:endogenous inhibitor of DNA gyrase (YacG/DUF329 family)